LILDSSAVVSMIIEEPGHERLLDATADAAEVAIGAPTLLEVEMVMIGRSGSRGRSLVAQFLERNDVEVIAFDEAHRRAAADAFISYGKGLHPAALNYGDCMTYATARVTDHPLLFIGKDFAKTDIPAVLD
jgi:ribonuclease VapC